MKRPPLPATAITPAALALALTVFSGLAALAGFAPAAAFAQAPPPGFYHMVIDSPVPAYSFKAPSALSRDGGTAIGSLLRNGSLTELGGWIWQPPSDRIDVEGPPNPTFRSFAAVSDGGHTIVGAAGEPRPPSRGDPDGLRYVLRAYRKVGDGPIEYLTPESTFWERSGAAAVSADGNTVAGIRVRGANDNDEQGFVWRADGTFVTIPYAQPFDFRMDVNGMSADGTKVVGTSESAGFAPFRAFRWTQEEGTVQLPRPAGTSGLYESYGNAISGNGRFIAGSAFSAQYEGAVIWDGLTAPMLVPDPPGATHSSRMDGVSNDGQIAFGYVSLPGDISARIWTSALGWEDPDDYFIRMGVQLPQGWNTNAIFDMSADGRVFLLTNDDFQDGTFDVALVVVPSPLTSAVLLTALAAYIGRRQSSTNLVSQ